MHFGMLVYPINVKHITHGREKITQIADSFNLDGKLIAYKEQFTSIGALSVNTEVYVPYAILPNCNIVLYKQNNSSTKNGNNTLFP